MFVSGNPALDLAGTLKWRGTASPEELLCTAEDLQEWVRQSGLLDHEPEISVTDLTRAKELREAIYQVATAAQTGRRSRPAALRLINAIAARPPLTPQYVQDAVQTVGDIDAVLSTLARAAIAAITTDRALLKSCARIPCTRLFIDRSRGVRRNWCGMNECGARVKMANYRERQRSRDARLAETVLKQRTIP